MLSVGIFTYLLPSDDAADASARAAHDIAQGLALRGHDVRVWTFGRKPPDVLYEVRELPFASFFRSRFGRSLLRGFLGHLMSIVPDYRDREVVLCFGDGLFLPLKHRRVLRVLHGSALAEARSALTFGTALTARLRYASELLEGRLLRTYRACLFVGASSVTRALNPGVRRVIPDGVDRTVFFPAPEEKTREPSILFVGELTGTARGFRILKWFSRVVQKRVPNARLLAVTPAGPAIPGVTYFRPRSAAELAELYRKAWVFACPSVYEPSGLRYLEAMASGTPVVATPNAGSHEILGGGKHGVLADDEHFPVELTEILVDAWKRQTWTDRGLQRAAEMDFARTLAAYEEVLRGLMVS